MSREIIYGCGISQEQSEINDKIYQELKPMFKFVSNYNYNKEDLNKYVLYSDLGCDMLTTVTVYIVIHTIFQTMKLR